MMIVTPSVISDDGLHQFHVAGMMSPLCQAVVRRTSCGPALGVPLRLLGSGVIAFTRLRPSGVNITAANLADSDMLSWHRLGSAALVEAVLSGVCCCCLTLDPPIALALDILTGVSGSRGTTGLVQLR